MGSDWSVSLLAADYGRTVGLVRDAIRPQSPADQQAILWDTAATVYRLNAGGLNAAPLNEDQL